MPQIYTFDDAQNALRPFYANISHNFTLEPVYALLEQVGSPQNKLRVLHVAGTSGKTSTAYYCAALLRESGKNVGLSVSPHIQTVNERLQINGAPLAEAEFCKVLGEFLDIVHESGLKLSYFEVLVGMAYWEFARRGVDYAVMEVGLGGLLDGTNVIDRPDKICLITDIGFDHVHILGRTLSEIAAQKAGIIKDENPVFMYEQSEEVMSSVRTAVAEHHAELHLLHDADMLDFSELPLFQQRNLGLAKRAVDFVLSRDYQESITPEILQRAAKESIPARLERFEVGDKLLILDGAHNQQKIDMLLKSVERMYPGKEMAVLCAFISGRREERWQPVLKSLQGRVRHIIFTSYQSEQDMPKTSMDPQELMQHCEEHDFHDCEVIDDVAEAYRTLLNRPEPILLVTGSLYLLGHVRRLIERQT